MLARVPRDVWIGLVLLVGAVLYWYGADNIPISPLDGEINAAAMPKALAYVLGALSLILIVRSLSLVAMGAAAAQTSSAEERAKARHAHLRAIGILVLGVGYLLVVNWLGYALSVALLIFCVATYVGQKPGLRLAGTAVALAAGFTVIFVFILGIPLPGGVLLDALR